MSAGFLLDEQLPKWWRRAINRLQPALKLRQVGQAGAPPLQSADPLLLEWCETNDFYLLTNNRSTMPHHLGAHVAAGRHIPGIFVVDPRMDIADLSNDLALIDGASFPLEHQDQIKFLPLHS